MSEKRYQVFVSSTYRDLVEERQKVAQVLQSMDCIPAGMELFSAIDEEQFEFIKKVIDDCDYYILILGGRYGSLIRASMPGTWGSAYAGKALCLTERGCSGLPLEPAEVGVGAIRHQYPFQQFAGGRMAREAD